MIDSAFNGFSAMSLIVTLTIILATYFIYKKVIKPYREFRFYQKLLGNQYKTHVHPYNILGLGNFGMYKADYLKYGDSQYTIKHQFPKYQVTLASFMGQIVFDLIDPELIKDYYEKQTEGYYIKALNTPFASSMRSIIGDGLVFSEGNQWKMKKKIMSNVFNHEFLKSKVQLIAKICRDKIEEVEGQAASNSQSEVKFDVSNLFQRIFGNVVVKSFFGDIELSKLEGAEMFTYLNSIFEDNTTRSLTLFAFFMGPNFYKYNLRKIDRTVNHKNENFKKFTRKTILDQIKLYEKSKQQKTDTKINGIIELLVKQNKLRSDVSALENNETKDYYTIEDLTDEFKTFFMAGTDTTSNSTTMLIYLLAQNPSVEEKLRKEIDEHFKSPLDIAEITYDSLKKLTYYDDVFKETLRMYSPNAGIFARYATKDHYIGKIPIKKGALVSVKIKPNHFKEEFFQNPHEFNPDRWSKRDPSKADPFSYFPFSAGQRICIGQHLAALESKIAVLILLKRYSKIELEKPNFKKYMRTLYAAEQMTTTFQKHKV